MASAEDGSHHVTRRGSGIGARIDLARSFNYEFISYYE